MARRYHSFGIWRSVWCRPGTSPSADLVYLGVQAALVTDVEVLSGGLHRAGSTGNDLETRSRVGVRATLSRQGPLDDGPRVSGPLVITHASKPFRAFTLRSSPARSGCPVSRDPRRREESRVTDVRLPLWPSSWHTSSFSSSGGTAWRSPRRRLCVGAGHEGSLLAGAGFCRFEWEAFLAGVERESSTSPAGRTPVCARCSRGGFQRGALSRDAPRVVDGQRRGGRRDLVVRPASGRRQPRRRWA